MVENSELKLIDDKQSPYAILGISIDATDDVITSARNLLAKRYHPDRFENSRADVQGIASSNMAVVNNAATALLDPNRRSVIDATFRYTDKVDIDFYSDVFALTYEQLVEGLYFIEWNKIAEYVINRLDPEKAESQRLLRITAEHIHSQFKDAEPLVNIIISKLRLTSEDGQKCLRSLAKNGFVDDQLAVGFLMKLSSVDNADPELLQQLLVKAANQIQNELAKSLSRYSTADIFQASLRTLNPNTDTGYFLLLEVLRHKSLVMQNVELFLGVINRLNESQPTCWTDKSKVAITPVLKDLVLEKIAARVQR